MQVAHTTRDKKKLLNRVRRIKGQVEAIERAIEGEAECASVLNTIAACRGAINGLMAEIIEGHVLFHVLDPARGPETAQGKAAAELIEVVNAYLK